MSWINASKITPKDKIGFVYRILELDTGMIYIGIKTLWSKIKRPPLKGKKRIRRCIVESKWRTYNSSNEQLADKIVANPKNYEKKILKYCDSITELKANEAYLQLDYYIKGNWDKLYNGIINLRLRIRRNTEIQIIKNRKDYLIGMKKMLKKQNVKMDQHVQKKNKSTIKS